MNKNFKTLICCILAVLFIAGTIVAVFADSAATLTKEAEVATDEVVTDVEEPTEDASEAPTEDASEETPEDTSSEVPTEDESNAPVVSTRLGDVDLDGEITAVDARLALRASAQLEKLEGQAAINADVIVDNVIKATDARLILRVAAVIEPESVFGKPPVEEVSSEA